MARPKADRRRKWRRSRQKQSSTGRSSTTGAPLLRERMESIPSLDLKDLPAVIREAAREENVYLQEDIVSLCLQRILLEMNPQYTRKPHAAQVRTIRRLIFGKGDTLLIARTGFGKSLILHAYSILTGKITIQIIPLSKLGDEQFHDIQRLPNTRPCLLTSESKKKEKDLIRRIQNQEFTHILLGPEQASSASFRDALKNAELQAQIGLVAIDECHLIKQWKVFRPEFTMLGELRLLLRQDIIWFGCSATLDSEAEELVLKKAGFRYVGPNPYETEIIRTSINRADISISICPIPRRKLTSYETLYFLLDRASDETGPTPEQIPKTIVFVDSRAQVATVAAYLQHALLSKSSSSDPGRRYSVCGEKAYCVYDIIQVFTSHVAQHDKDTRYAEFNSPLSTIRIMIATTSLGIGVNIPDVDRVVTWRFPIDDEPGEIWQRIGRGGRGEGRRSQAYIFLPYWVFDSEGCDRPDAPLPASAIEKRAKSKRNTLPSHRAQSRLSSSFVPDELSDTESVASAAESVASSVSMSSQPTRNSVSVRYWTKEEMSKRAGLSNCWKAICNGACKRAAFLEKLGERHLPEGAERIVVESFKCCNGCNPSLTPILTPAPETNNSVSEPKAATAAGFALDLLKTWAATQAEAHSTHSNRRFPLPASAFMKASLCWQLAHLYGGKGQPDAWWDSLTIEKLCEEADLLRLWPYQAESGDLLVSQMQSFVKEVEYKVTALRSKRKEAKDAKLKQKEPTALDSISRDDGTPRGYIAQNRARDDALAIQVARQEAHKAAHRLGIKDPRNQSSIDAPITASSPAGMSGQLRTPQSLSALLPTAGGSVSNDLFRGFQSATEMLAKVQAITLRTDDFISSLPTTPERQERRAIPDTQLDSNTEGLHIVLETQLDEKEVLVEVVRETQIQEEGGPVNTLPATKRYATPLSQHTPSKRRRVLGEGDLNKGQTVTSSPVRRSGRKRIMTSRGEENMRTPSKLLK